VKQVGAVATDAKTVVVKRAINPRAVDLRPLDEVRQEIEQAAKEGVARAQRRAPTREATYKVEVQFRETFIPEVAESIPGMQRPAPDTIAFSADSMPRAYTLIRLLYRYINPD
jgi:D-amino peptidase